jgi:hypothetical protein
VDLEIVYCDPGGEGYHPVLHMARLAAELLGARLTTIHPSSPGRARKLLALFPRTRGSTDCLFICPSPSHLASLIMIDGWRRSYGTLIAWVFDSFWPEMIPAFARMRCPFDRVFVTEREDLGTWRRTLRVPVDWLPWGADVLRLGSGGPDRPIDLVRVGRQPPDWDDDATTRGATAARGLCFEGRPPSWADASENERQLMQTFSRSKYTLSSTNIVSPSIQTHPTREYITARWTDALAAGAIVAGIPPRSETVQELLWPEALLDLRTTKVDEALDVLVEDVRRWNPTRAALNHARALERLDWRWRFLELAQALSKKTPVLDRELAKLRVPPGGVREIGGSIGPS